MKSLSLSDVIKSNNYDDVAIKAIEASDNNKFENVVGGYPFYTPTNKYTIL